MKPCPEVSEPSYHRKARAQEAGVLVDACDYYRAFANAAASATRSILMLGWQFDSRVHLVRGDEPMPGGAPRELRRQEGDDDGREDALHDASRRGCEPSNACGSVRL